MRYGAIYARRGQFILHPDGRTTAGVLIGLEPYVVLPLESDPATIGSALRRVLAGSRSNVRHPSTDEWERVAEPLYRAAGVKSWGTFVRGAILASIEADDHYIRLLPQENRGARDGFQPMGLPVIEVPLTASDEEVGTAALSAIKIARSREPDRDA